jgi:hypothetical protein
MRLWHRKIPSKRSDVSSDATQSPQTTYPPPTTHPRNIIASSECIRKYFKLQPRLLELDVHVELYLKATIAPDL